MSRTVAPYDRKAANYDVIVGPVDLLVVRLLFPAIRREAGRQWRAEQARGPA
jgi:hypothetical protein